MLNQMGEVSHVTPSSLEEIRQKRLAYFSTMQQHEPVKNASEDQFSQLLIPERIAEIETSLKFQVKNKSNSNNDHNFPQSKKHSLAADGHHTEGRLPERKSESLNSAEISLPNNHKVEERSMLNMGESHNFTINQLDNIHQGSPYSQPYYFVDDLSTHHSDFRVENSQKNISGQEYIPSTLGQGKFVQGIFSDKTTEEIRSALGEQGLRNVMMKVTRDLQQLHKGRTSGEQSTEQRKIETDVVSEVQSGRSSRSSSVDSSDMRNTQYPKQSSQRVKRYRSHSPHRRTSTVTKNLQQLKEGEEKMNLLIRNYNQITIPTNTKNAFSADEIYQQAFGRQSEPAQKQPNGHTYPGPLPFNGQDKEEHSSPSGVGFRYPRRQFSFDSSTNMASNCSPPVYHMNMFQYPPPPLPHHPHPTFEPHFSGAVPLSPMSPGILGSQFMPQDEAHPLHNYWYSSSNSQLPSQYCSDMSHMYMYYKSVWPLNLFDAFQKSPNSSYNPSPPYIDTFGVPVFTDSIPIHLPPPPLPQHLKNHTYTIQQLQPYPPASSRRGSLTQPGASKPQVMPDHLTSGQNVRAPHPPRVPPAIQLKDDPYDLSQNRLEHRYMSGGNSYQDAQHQPQHGSSESYNLQRYFSSLEECSRNTVNSFSELSVTSNQSIEGDLHRNRADALSICTDYTGTSAGKAGGLTQRLKDLDIDLDKLKHLRGTDTKGDQTEADADFERLSKGIKYCQECSSSNKAYMDWCTNCGELLIGIEPTFPKKRNKNGISQEKKRTESSVKTRGGRNFIHPSVKPTAVNMKYGGNEYPHQESPESGRGLSPSCSPVQHQLEQDNFREPKDSGRESNDAMQEEDSEPAQMEEIFKKEDDDVLADKMKEEDLREVGHKYDDAEMNIVAEITDPILREFIISYKRRQLSQQNTHPDQNIGKDSKAPSVKPTISGSGAAASGAAKSLNSGNEAINTSCTDQNYTSRNIQETKAASPFQMLPSKSSPVSSLLNKSEVKNNEILLPPTKYSSNKITVENVSSELWADSKSSEVQAENSKFKKRKKKKLIRGESIDIEIFGYDETRKSRDQAVNRVTVPALNLKCSSDEEESDSADGDDEEVEDDPSDNDSNELAVKCTQGSSPNSFNPEKSQTCVKSLPGGDLQSISIGRTPQQQPMRTVHASPPRPCKSDIPLHHQRSRGNVGVPASYQRHWARSSTAWSSYNPRELSTRSSLNNFHIRSAPQRVENQTRVLTSASHGKGSQLEANGDFDSSGTQVRRRPSSADYKHRQPTPESYQRPSSAKVRSSNQSLQVHPPVTSSRNGFPSARQHRYTAASGGQRDTAATMRSRSALLRTPNVQEGSSLANVTTVEALLKPENANNGTVGSDNDSPRLLCAEFHRLPQTEAAEMYTDRLHAVAKNAYDKIQEMTPRIAKGHLSRWQCLPDEIWLYIFNFLSQGNLKNLMLTSRYFHRLANDETLWKYITVKPRYSMTDISLATIAHHQPLSLAMVKCQGNNVTLDGLDYFFKETQGRLRELNICGCSQGSLVGSVVLKVASQYCQKLTHLDASFCNVSDEAFIAISDCAERLESVCVNGFQSMSDSSLLVLLKKHGKSLGTLELYACFSLSASAFHSIGEYCTSLKRLCLGSCNKLTDSAMITLSTYLAHIEELDLRGCKNLRNDCIRKIVRNCPRIRTLVLANCHQISDIALTEIATYLKTTLYVLDVCGCNRVTDNGVASLAKNCDHLVSLDISSTRCTNLSVHQLADSSCSQWLETIRLSFLSGLTETCMLSLIHQCPRLKSVHVFGCSSLKNLARLQSANSKLSLEGDSGVARSMFS